jgi:FKBP-type peptidyl-prolyl cis-trans isomerase
VEELHVSDRKIEVSHLYHCSPLMNLRLPRLVALSILALTFAACDSGGDDEPDVAQAGDRVTVAYTGTLQDGTVFDQSQRAEFSLDRVIPGFRDGVIGMREEETKTFDVPPEEGYGDNPPEGVPPGATLTFEVTLLDVQ